MRDGRGEHPPRSPDLLRSGCRQTLRSSGRSRVSTSGAAARPLRLFAARACPASRALSLPRSAASIPRPSLSPSAGAMRARRDPPPARRHVLRNFLVVFRQEIERTLLYFDKKNCELLTSMLSLCETSPRATARSSANTQMICSQKTRVVAFNNEG